VPVVYMHDLFISNPPQDHSHPIFRTSAVFSTLLFQPLGPQYWQHRFGISA
jgi:hypothetical protein